MMTDKDTTDYKPTPQQLEHTRYIKALSAEAVKADDKRAKKRSYGSSSPVVSALEIEYRHRIEDRIDQLLIRAADKHTARYVAGIHVQLVKLLQQFLSEGIVTPTPDEIAQPFLGRAIVAGCVVKAAIDACYRAHNRSVGIVALADTIAKILRAELRMRQAANSNDQAVIDAVRIARGTYATKSRSTLKYRLTNINLVLDRAHAIGFTSGGSKHIKEAAVALVSLAATPLGDDPPLLEQLDSKTIRLSEAVWEQLKGKKEFLERSAWSHIPLNTPPLPWRYTGNPDADNATGGYPDRHIRGRFPLGHGKHEEYRTVASREAIAALNAFQATGYKIDKRVAEFIEKLFASSEPFDGWYPLFDYTTDTLQKAKSDPDHPDHTHYTKLPVNLRELVIKRDQLLVDYPDKEVRNRTQAWNTLMQTLKYSYAEIIEAKARSIRTTAVVSRLRELQSDHYPDGIWWAAGFDHRGRMYSKSDILSPQASPAERFSLLFLNGERLTQASKREVYVAIGSALVSDKLSVTEREQLGRDNWQRCINAGEDLWAERGWLDGADDPWYLAALCSSIYGHEVLGEVWCRPIFLDATSSVLQHLCCISNDVNAMVHCNLRSTDDEAALADAYQKTKELLEAAKQKRWKPGGIKLGWIKNKNGVYVDPYATRADGSQVYPREAKLLDELLASRAALKLNLMTGLYGSSVTTRIDKLISDNQLTAPWQREVAGAATRLINASMRQVYPGSFELLMFVKAVAKASTAERLSTLAETKAVQLYGTVIVDGQKRPYCSIAAFDTLIQQTNIRKRPTLDEALCTDAWRQLKTATPEQERLILKEYNTNRKTVKNTKAQWLRINEADSLLRAMDAFNADTKLEWYLPDGFKVVAREPYLELGRQVQAGVLSQVSIRFEANDSIDTSKLIRASAPSLIHSYDAWLLRRLILDLDTQACCIHDSVGVLPSQIETLLASVRKYQAQLCPDNDGRNILKRFIDDLIQSDVVKAELIEALMEKFPAMPAGFVFSEELQKARPWN